MAFIREVGGWKKNGNNESWNRLEIKMRNYIKGVERLKKHEKLFKLDKLE